MTKDTNSMSVKVNYLAFYLKFTFLNIAVFLFIGGSDRTIWFRQNHPCQVCTIFFSITILKITLPFSFLADATETVLDEHQPTRVVRILEFESNVNVNNRNAKADIELWYAQFHSLQVLFLTFRVL